MSQSTSGGRTVRLNPKAEDFLIKTLEINPEVYIEYGKMTKAVEHSLGIAHTLCVKSGKTLPQLFTEIVIKNRNLQI